jgi:hypothetical protein
MKVDISGISNLRRAIAVLKKKMKGNEMQMYRAKKFRNYTIKMVRGGNLNLKKLSDATKKISGDHNPEWNSGSLVRSMEVRAGNNNDAFCGYFSNSNKMVKGKKITVTQAAILQHTGFRIPLFGEKGRRVKAWFTRKGVFQDLSGGDKPSGSKRWIIVPARPYMFISKDKYDARGLDKKACNEYLNKVLSKEFA